MERSIANIKGDNEYNARIRYSHQPPYLSNGLAQIKKKEESIA